MVQPISLSMAHFNVEHSARMSRDALAAAQQTGQGQEVVQESVRRTQRVQAGMAAAEVRKVQRKDEDEEREHRRDEEKGALERQPRRGGDADGEEEDKGKEEGAGGAAASFDFYA